MSAFPLNDIACQQGFPVLPPSVIHFLVDTTGGAEVVITCLVTLSLFYLVS